jgi:hypothetical protein
MRRRFIGTNALDGDKARTFHSDKWQSFAVTILIILPPNLKLTHSLSLPLSRTHHYQFRFGSQPPTANRQICLSAKKLINNEFIIEFPFSLS